VAWALFTFHSAYRPEAGWWIALFPLGVVPLMNLPTGRQVFYTGLALGFGLYAPQLGFFWTIFGPPAALLWGVLALWLAVFLVLARVLRPVLGSRGMLVATPVLWTGTEYFRSELYFLRFSWLSPGYALAGSTPMGILPWVGVYGTGALLFLAGATFWYAGGWKRWLGPGLAVAVVASNEFPLTPRASKQGHGRELTVAGAQIESLDEASIPSVLGRLATAYPAAELLILPEYSLSGEPPPEILDWCRTHRRHLVIGGIDRISDRGFQNTAWVVDADGRVVFRQAKSVPIQFFDDGLPAPSQAAWESPWGRIGIAVCYDLSYARVIDRLVTQGAQALVIPTMDALSWGRHQHALHARIAPVRAAEYGIPIVRCASSGISQIVDRRGRVTTEAPMDADVRIFAGTIRMAAPGSLPIDRWLAPACSAATAAAVLLLAGQIRWKGQPVLPQPSAPAASSPHS
jgi:apolipoprotein N-acyltransferase